MVRELAGYEGFLSSCRFLDDSHILTGSGDMKILDDTESACGLKLQDPRSKIKELYGPSAIAEGQLETYKTIANFTESNFGRYL
ncbi:Guanine nucleotide-binding protein subunit beta-2 [Eumeta japonica]|uniref:Guanine nucleotide-binding protein subunit beta-2 n=1 Tax=Eumeta variegata TaxID=151549 RepID=A0A4C1SL46_EUMVA|nr:Guanine nucleotide-binding protein subunit beta-2 [Eumeta japonica]